MIVARAGSRVGLSEPFRFLIAGGGAAALNWAVRIPLSAAMPFPAAVLVAALIGMAAGFLAYRAFVFPGSERTLSRQLVDFVLVNAASTIAVVAAAFIARGILLQALSVGTAEAMAHAFGIGVGAVLNYIGHRLLTFGDRPGAPDRETMAPYGPRTARPGHARRHSGSRTGLFPHPAGVATALATAGIILLAVGVAALLIPNPSDDTRLWFVPWMERMIELGPRGSLAGNFANYTPPFVYVLAVASLGAGWAEPLVLVKLACLVGSLACAASFYGLVRVALPPRAAGLASAALLLVPTVALNAAAWGQSDAFYTAALLVCVASALRGRFALMMTAFGIAVSFKLQAVILGPFVLFVVVSRRVPLWAAALSPLVVAVLMLPAVAAGRPVPEIASIYLDQAQLFRSLSMNAPNLWSFVQRTGLVSYESGVMLGLAMATLGGCAIAALAMRCRFGQEGLIVVAVVSATAMPFLLPKMHDRYFFAADVLSFGLAVMTRSRWAVLVAMLIQLGSLGAYLAYLLEFKLGTYAGAICMAAALTLLLRRLLEMAQREAVEPAPVRAQGEPDYAAARP